MSDTKVISEMVAIATDVAVLKDALRFHGRYAAETPDQCAARFALKAKP